ncbi:ABC transporter permease [candidate division KSB1 bacterium]
MSDERKNVPKTAGRITKYVFKPGVNKYASGDLEEEFKLVEEESGRKRAYLWYWQQILFSLFPYIRDGIANGLILFRNYVKLASRNLVKHKSYSLINIFGLTFGIAFCLITVLGVMWEASYNRFHENGDRLFRITEVINEADRQTKTTYTVAPLGPTLKVNYPEVVDATRIAYQGEILLRHKENKFYESDGIAVDNSFFKMLTFQFVYGENETALADPNSIVITETIAEKLFGDTPPLGEVINVNNDFEYIVTGVIEDVPLNSEYRFSFVLPWEFMKTYEWFQEDIWNNHNYPTIIMLEDNEQAEELNNKIANIFDDYINQDDVKIEISIQSVPDMHLNTENNGMTGWTALFIWGFLAFFVLLISCFNFMNLATARSSFRYKEIGVRKVVGGTRKNIIIQFLSESFILSLLSLIIALIILYPLIILIEGYTGADIVLDFTKNWWLLIVMLGITIFTGIISGLYPALYLSSFNPLKVLKGTYQSGQKSPLLRRIMVSAQLGLTIIFMIVGFISAKQFDHLMNHNMGWDRENLIYVRMRGESNNSYELLKNELLKNPGIQNVTAVSQLPMRVYGNTDNVSWPDKVPDIDINISFNVVDYDFIEAVKIKISEGRAFSKEFQDDQFSFVINETLAEIIGTDPVIGMEFNVWYGSGRIIGIVEDFNFRSLKSEIQPMVLLLAGNISSMQYMLVKLNSENTVSSIDFINKTWDRILPDYPFEHKFIDSDLYQMYNDEDAMGIMMKGLSVFTLLITSLGLMALVSFITEKRKKEIGVRKVLGSSISRIIRLISREFLILTLISNTIAIPSAYFLMKAFLSTYPYQTTMGIWIFVLSGISISSIALATVVYQTFKAARTNPVDILRYE